MELQAMIVGNQEYDWEELEKVILYSLLACDSFTLYHHFAAD